MTPEQYVQNAIRTEHTPTFIVTNQDASHDQMLSRCMHAILGMMTELGELADVFKKHLIYGKPIDMINVIEENGDQDWYRALFADAIKVGFSQAWEINIAKLRARYPDKFTSDQALNRDLAGEQRVLAEGFEGLEGNPKG